VKLSVIGAIGRTGREVVQQALARNHHVTAFVRSPEGITLSNERLTVLKGNAMDENELFRAMQNTMRWSRPWDREKFLNQAQCSMTMLLRPLEQ
jgi:putative NADH-flavin reductase